MGAIPPEELEAGFSLACIFLDTGRLNQALLCLDGLITLYIPMINASGGL